MQRVLTPSADAFAALARSSPWRWSTLRFTVRWPGDPWKTESLRAWLRRPDLLRVETVEGEFRQIVREHGQRVGVLTSSGGFTKEVPWPRDGERPDRRRDGLVAERPEGLSYDAPMYQDYAWVAMLDPVELADGRDLRTGDVAGPALIADDVAGVDHFGRPAWEAVVRPTDAYEPRCACCPLLRTRRIDLLEYGDDLERVLPTYPEAFRLRLDVGTGVCVRTEQIGGLTPGAGHDLRIEAVDDPMDDALFRPPAGPRREPAGGWQPVPGQYPGPT
jgi:hypothetical protein